MGSVEFPQYSMRERVADGCIHAVGVTASLAAFIALLVIAVMSHTLLWVVSLAIYGVALVLMFSCSAGYNLVLRPKLKAIMRRLDHAAIFLMIAGSYTPFTTQRFDYPWSIVITTAIWTVAVVAAAGKLLLPGLSRRIWLLAYLALGWAGVCAFPQFLDGVSRTALVLIAIGGALYTIGVPLYASTRLRFRRAIWHAFVLAAACVHYAAVMVGVVFAAARA